MAGRVFAWIGLVVPSMKSLYDYGWFVGFGVALIVHYALMKLSKPSVLPAEPEAA